MTSSPSPSPGVLSPAQRARDLERTRTEQFDVVVVGGGITGSGIALDARSRGLSVLLIEASDFAAGTSSKSSKLIHGGLRYLEMLDFSLVREALRERKMLLHTLAPHLVKPVPFIWPLTHRVWERAYLGAGLVLYDTMGGAGALPRHRHLSKRAMRRIAPGLNPDAFVGGVRFFDAIEDDARYTMVVARTASAEGAALLTGAAATGFDVVNDRVVGVEVLDAESGESFTVRARHVAVAAGPWAEQVLALLPGDGTRSVTVRPSKGIHMLVPGDRIDSDSGVLMRTEKSVLFVIPWEGHWMIGDTDTAWNEDRGTPVATSADVDYLLAKVNTVLARPLTTDDIVGVFAGLRPLVHNANAVNTTKISREHVVSSPRAGMSLIAGGKYTTYRVMAKDVVDVVAKDLGTDAVSRTHQIPLVGAARYDDLFDRPQASAVRAGITVEAYRRLLDRYGDLAEDLVALIERDPSLREPLEGAAPSLRVEAAYAFAHEGARSVDDVLERRTRIRIQVADSGLACVEDVAQLGAAELGWSDGERQRQVDAYRASVAAQAAAMAETTDADALRAYRDSLTAAPTQDV